MWTTCADCVEHKDVGIAGNLVMVIGNSLLPAALQAERNRHEADTG